MIIYVVQYYHEDGTPEDIIATNSKLHIRDWLSTCAFENEFSEDFDIVGYDIPNDIAKKFGKNAERIHDEYIAKEDAADIADKIVFYQSWVKKHQKI